MTRVTRLIHNAGKYLLIHIYPLPTHPTHNFTHKNGGNLDTFPGWPKQLHLNRPAQCAGQQYTMAMVQIKIWYQKRHSIPCPRGQAIECLLWVCQNKLPSNIHSSLGYSTFYSQLIRFHRLCNNKTDFLFRAKLICQKLINRGYKFNLLRKSFMRFTKKYPVEIKYGVQRYDNLFLQMLYFDNYVICNINRDDVNTIVSPCCVKIENIAKLPLHKQNKLILPHSQNLKHAHKVRWCYPFPNRLAERKQG